MNSYAQNKEDLVLMKFFGDHRGVYIDVGAHDGIQFSNTYLLEKQGWHGMCIEPNPGSFALLEKNRTAICIRTACHDLPDEEISDLLIPNNTPVLGTLRRAWDAAEVARIFNIPIANVNFHVMKVKCVPLYSLIIDNLHKHPQIDLVSIDTEGTELQVLAGMDVARFEPRVLVIEANNGQAAQELKVYLKAFGYVLAGRVAVNFFFVKPDDVQAMKRAIGTV